VPDIVRKLLPILFLSVSIVFLLPAVAPFHARAQISVTTGHTGQELAEYLLGRGIQVFNVSLTGAADICGKFTNRNSNLAMDSGVVLTSGLAKNVRTSVGINSLPGALASNDRGGRGDADIDRLLQQAGAPPALRSLDACVLEFDFVPTGDSVSFKYTFGSEEYPTYNCSDYNDLFIFYISGPGISGKKNMATVPGTNIPVAINSINNGIVNPRSNITNCEALGAGCPFTQYYVDNSNAGSIVYNGLTVTLRAVHAVRPCQIYHLKMVIADLGDGALDSGVFLEGGSFQSEYATLTYSGPTDNNGEPLLTEGCEPAQVFVRYSRPLPQAKDLQLETGGDAENFLDLSPFVPSSVTLPSGETLISFPISAVQDMFDEGDEYVTIFVSPKTCGTPIFTDSLRIRIRDYKKLNVVPDSSGVCPGNNVQLNVVSPGLSNFIWSPAAGLSNINISNPLAQPDTTTLYSVVANSTPTCRSKGTALVQVKDSASIQWIKRDISCFGNDGSITVIPGFSWVSPQYSINGSPFSPLSRFLNLSPGFYVVRVLDATGCLTSRSFTLVRLEDVTATIRLVTANCFGINGKVIVTATGGQRPYQYSLNGLNYNTDSTIILEAGPRTVFVKDDNGCTFSMPFTLLSDPPIRFNMAITPDSCRGLADGTITINANGGSGLYEYSSNGTVYQPGNRLRLTAGVYDITVRDDKECFTTLPATVPLNNTLVLDAGLDSTICEGKSFIIPATGNADAYEWSPATGLSDAQILRPLASPDVTTEYKIKGTSGLCEKTDSLTIFVNKAPFANAGNDTTICYNDKAQLNGSGSLRYIWYPAQYISNRNIANPMVYPRRTGAYWLHVIDEKGCRSLVPDSVLITVVAPVKAFAGNDTIVTINQALQLNASGGTSYIWSPPTGLNDAQIANPIAILQNHQTYQLTAITPEGCIGSTTINIKVFKGPEIYVAGAFTPNDDGNNDILFAIPAGIKKFTYFKIYNRWGKEVFSTTDYRKGWNGRLLERDQPTDAYIWMASAEDINGKTLFRKGSVVLIR
jgi:gliding motility-associated-like protein